MNDEPWSWKCHDPVKPVKPPVMVPLNRIRHRLAEVYGLSYDEVDQLMEVGSPSTEE